MLEGQLAEIDEKEEACLFLGSSRDDTNEDRRETMAKVDSALAEYGIHPFFS